MTRSIGASAIVARGGLYTSLPGNVFYWTKNLSSLKYISNGNIVKSSAVWSKLGRTSTLLLLDAAVNSD